MHQWEGGPWRDYTSHLAWEGLCVLLDKLEGVVVERDV